ncbi:MAG TPA: hypothetical protein VN901_11300 [Candidatus Acidoferrales bacterium]|nr:hypothetical protein [Candidatus Acidoferrales bacterium]
MPDDEDGRLVSRILRDVTLLGNPDKEAGALPVRDLLFDIVGRQHALKVTNGIIAEGINLVAENQGVGLGLNQARFVKASPAQMRGQEALTVVALPWSPWLQERRSGYLRRGLSHRRLPSAV